MKTFIIALRIFLFLTVLTGIIYPVFITGIAQIVYPSKANGSLIIHDNKAIGSKLIGQSFDSVIYFTSRPSAISYDPLPSGGSNFGLTNAKLNDLVVERKKQFIAFNKLDSISSIPSEMLFASASGLDPHISPESALLQVERIAKARNLSFSQQQGLLQCITDITEAPQFWCLGQERINVLVLNLELDELDDNNTSKK